MGRVEMEWSASGQGHVKDCCERGNEHSASIKYGEFLDQVDLRNSEDTLSSVVLVR